MFLRLIAIVLVVVGFVLVVVGVSTMAGKVEEAPTTVPIAAVEKGEVPADVKWLKVPDGQLYWPGLAKLIMKDKKTGKEAETSGYYVPVLSAEAIAGMTGHDKPLPLEKCRLFAFVKQDQLKAAFPDALNETLVRVSDKYELDGTTETLASADSIVRDHYAQNAAGLDMTKVRLLSAGKKPLQKGTAGLMTGVGALIAVAGVGLWLLLRRAKRAAAEAHAAAHHHGGAGYGVAPVAAVPVAALPVTDERTSPPVAGRTPPGGPRA